MATFAVGPTVSISKKEYEELQRALKTVTNMHNAEKAKAAINHAKAMKN